MKLVSSYLINGLTSKVPLSDHLLFLTGIKLSATRPPKVYSIKGKKQVGVASSAERGQLMTVVCCMSAAGTFVPPTMIFPRKKINPNFRKNLPPDTYCLPSETGWINTNLFLKWLEFFVEQVRPSESRKALIILDNHESHRSLEAIEFARKNHIVLLSVPPHTTHKLQPLDVSLFRFL